MVVFEAKEIKYKKHKKAIESIEKPAQVAELLKDLNNDPHEKFCLLLMNAQNGILRKEYYGLLDRCAVNTHDIYKQVILWSATRVIIAHNHPSGKAYPSQADRDITEKLKKGLKLLDVELLDHVIVTQDDYYSFQANNDI